MRIRVIGGGLAGPEAALTAARLGCEVDLYEMRAVIDGRPRLTPAHQTTDFGELVCSNSLKSESPNTAPWLLKQEMRRAGSALLCIADATAVPAGHALAVDRVEFSRRISEAIAAEPRIRVIREEVTSLQSPDGEATVTIVATGPLTSDALGKEIERLTGAGHLAFYDSISCPTRAEGFLINDLVAGNVQMTFESTTVLLPLIEAGRLRALAVTTAKRIPQLPNVPTMVESGYPAFVTTAWTGLLAPAHTPAPIVAKLNAAINAGLKSPEMTKALADLTLDPLGGTPADFTAQIKSDTAKWSPIIKSLGLDRSAQ